MTDTIDSRIWWWHLYLIAWLPLALGYAQLAPVGGGGETLGIVLGLSVVAAAVASLVGYYIEARRFRAAGSDWVPRWWAYALGHVLLTPFLSAPVYLIQRYRHAG